MLGSETARADLAARQGVVGSDVTGVEVADARRVFQPVAWDELAKTPRAPGTYTLRMSAGGNEAIELPVCSGRGRVSVDGAPVPVATGPLLVRLSAGAREVTMEVTVSGYEKRIACGAAPRIGVVKAVRDGLLLLTFSSPSGAAGGGRAVVFVPPGHDRAKPGPLLVGAHPWGGGIWTYAAYAELLREAALRDGCCSCRADSETRSTPRPPRTR